MRQFPRYILKKYLGTRGRGGTSGYKPRRSGHKSPKRWEEHILSRTKNGGRKMRFVLAARRKRYISVHLSLDEHHPGCSFQERRLLFERRTRTHRSEYLGRLTIDPGGRRGGGEREAGGQGCPRCRLSMGKLTAMNTCVASPSSCFHDACAGFRRKGER